ncbi:MAG: DJ-1/PfpI family protein [Anaerolineae bacterium]|nr:DJ-1/PfpI family protein [Anaerolineae bacterium]MCB9102837.1 DJ-1/PfpI family protein [Anaerolineales bacterium]
MESFNSSLIVKWKERYDKLLSVMIKIVTNFRIMPNMRHNQTIVLLADGFDEVPTITVITALRDAGLRTKLVGLRSKPTAGSHGIVLIPDLSLSQLLETRTSISTLIVPGGGGHLERLRQDPRVNLILQRSTDSNVAFVTIGQGADKLLKEYVGDGPQCLSLYAEGLRTNELGCQIVNWLLETERE